MKIIIDALNPTSQGRNFLAADWSAPANVKALITTRNDGTSKGVYRSLNVGSHISDNPQAVLRGREIVQEQIGLPTAYLNQVHSTIVVNVAEALGSTPDADTSVDTTDTVACVSMTVDCLLVLSCDKAETVVVVVHAGWRDLAGGVLQNAITVMKVEPLGIMAYPAPAIDPDAFEVGQDVFDVFCTPMPGVADAFEDIGGGRYLADIYALVRMVLRREGMNMIYNDTHCTASERDILLSRRRDG